jgi:hypothetical protein
LKAVSARRRQRYADSLARNAVSRSTQWARLGRGEDPFHVSDRARIALGIDPRLRVPEIGERSGYGNVSEREAITDQIAALVRHGSFEIVEDRRQIVELRLLRGFNVARTAEKARCDDQVEKDLRSARDENGVGEFLEPDGFPAGARLCRDQRRLREFRFEIVNDRAGIGERVIAVTKARHLPERTRGTKIGIGIAGTDRRHIEFDALLSGVGEHFAYEGRQRRAVQNHGETPPR